ncbi:electron transfer complex subunit TmcD [Desulfospira joergensenii]|uniref:electron transfer complex subunit TmcD n=1 Tax=Desulfospira joergensenii TaxID=53329 RepID=UPI0003B404D8|nr:hypothetical protein [Desulfospira joergensenii]
MEEKESWDWSTDLKEIPVKEWETRFNWVEEPCISPDGERVASIVNVDEMVFGICENGEVWEGEYEKAWSLKALPNNQFIACVCQDEEWTLAVNGEEWENRFDFIWDLQVSSDGAHIGLAIQRDSEYGMAVNDKPWETLYENLSGAVMGETGATAGVVQVESMGAADVDAFKKGIFSVALNGKAFDKKFLNAWDISFDRKNQSLAWGVRIDRERYTIAVNGTPWTHEFQSVWKPVFAGEGQSVLAPVRHGGKWKLFKDDKVFWETGYQQLWHVTQSEDKIAAIVAPSYGKWSVAQDDRVWPLTIDTMIREIRYSEDGSSLVAVVKDKDFWTLIKDGSKWKLSCDKVFAPVISADGSILAAAVEKQGRWFVAANDELITGPYDCMADPVISPDNSKVLVKGIENGVYKRRIIAL